MVFYDEPDLRGVFTFCLYRNMSGITFPVITAVSLAFSTASS